MLAVNRKNQRHLKELARHRRSTIRNERKWKSGIWHYISINRNIDDRLNGNVKEDSDHNGTIKTILNGLRNLNHGVKKKGE